MSQCTKEEYERLAGVAPSREEVDSPPALSETVEAAIRACPPETWPTLEAFASGMGEDLLTVWPARCGGCQFGSAVRIRTQSGAMVWGCPQCGLTVRPVVISPVVGNGSS